MTSPYLSLSPQLHRELRLRNIKAKDTGNYTCAVIKGYDSIAERYGDSTLWTVFGAEGNEERARILLDSLETTPENLSTLVIAEVKTIRLRVRTIPPAVSEFTGIHDEFITWSSWLIMIPIRSGTKDHNSCLNLGISAKELELLSSAELHGRIPPASGQRERLGDLGAPRPD